MTSTSSSSSSSSSSNPTDDDLASSSSTTVTSLSPSLSGSRIDFHQHVSCPPLDSSSSLAISTLRASLLSDPLYSSSAYARFYCTDACLYRFLRARQFDQKKSRALLLAAIEWRESARPDEISADEVEEESRTGKMAVEQLDRHGRPIWVMDQRRNTKIRSHESAIKHLLFHLERTKQLMHKSNQARKEQAEAAAAGGGADAASTSTSSSTSPSSSSSSPSFVGEVEKYCLFIHLQNYSMFNSPPLKTSMETTKTLTDRYVEHLGTAILYQPPAFFSVLWKMCQPFLDKHTVNKIIFLRGDVSDGSENDRLMRDVVGDNWKKMCDVGGEGEGMSEYRHEEVWPRVRREQEEWWEVVKEERERQEREEKEAEEQERQQQQQPALETNGMSIVMNGTSEASVPSTSTDLPAAVTASS